MPNETRVVRPGPRPGTVLTDKGEVLTIPSGFALLPPGDAGVTRRVKATGSSWTVQEKVGRKMFSRGVYADAARIEAVKSAIELERESPTYQKRLDAGRARREEKQEAYVEDFRGAVLAYLRFPSRYEVFAGRLADAVTKHATPVGSGTVARTERIPIAARAEAAVIAWMRHQTTAYDDMQIARIKGERRRVRQMLAQRSKSLLDAYRRGEAVDVAKCPLVNALTFG